MKRKRIDRGFRAMVARLVIRREDYWHRVSAMSRARRNAPRKPVRERLAAWIEHQSRSLAFDTLRVITVLASRTVSDNNERISFLSLHPVTPRGFKDAYYAQLRASAVALREAGAAPKGIRAFLSANASPDWRSVRIKGGNFHFTGADSFHALINVSPHQRCNQGSLGTLDFSHGRNSLHLDAANPFNFPIGTFRHLIIDIIGGSYWHAVIPVESAPNYRSR